MSFGFVESMLLITVIVGIGVVFMLVSDTKRPCPYCRAMMPKKKTVCPHCNKAVRLGY